MIYITGDTHNTKDMSNLSSKNMKLCCIKQKADYNDISTAIVLGDFTLPWAADSTDNYLMKWYKQKPFMILA